VLPFSTITNPSQVLSFSMSVYTMNATSSNIGPASRSDDHPTCSGLINQYRQAA